MCRREELPVPAHGDDMTVLPSAPDEHPAAVRQRWLWLVCAYSIVGFLVSFDLIRLSREGEAIVQILYFEAAEAPFVKLAAILFVFVELGDCWIITQDANCLPNPKVRRSVYLHHCLALAGIGAYSLWPDNERCLIGSLAAVGFSAGWYGAQLRRTRLLLWQRAFLVEPAKIACHTLDLAIAVHNTWYLVKSHRIYNTEVTWQHMDAVVMIAGGLLLMVMLSMNKKAYAGLAFAGLLGYTIFYSTWWVFWFVFSTLQALGRFIFIFYVELPMLRFSLRDLDVEKKDMHVEKKD